MNSQHRFLIATCVVLFAGALSLVYAPALRDPMVTHWNAAGQPDGTIAKPLALAFIPAIAGVSVLLFAVFPRIDSLGDNIASFRAVYDWFVIVFATFLTAIHAGIIAFNLGYQFDFTLLVVILVSGLLFNVGILLNHAKRNWFVGIRTPWTLSNQRVWDRTHRLGGQLFKGSALVTLLGLFFEDYAIYFLVVPSLLAAGITVVYSYYLYGNTDSSSEQDSVESA